MKQELGVLNENCTTVAFMLTTIAFPHPSSKGKRYILNTMLCNVVNKTVVFISFTISNKHVPLCANCAALEKALLTLTHATCDGSAWQETDLDCT